MNDDTRTDHEHETIVRVEPLRLKLDEARREGARIKVIGVGGGGGNAVNRMVRTGRRASSSSSPTPTCRRSPTTPRRPGSRSAAS